MLSYVNIHAALDQRRTAAAGAAGEETAAVARAAAGEGAATSAAAAGAAAAAGTAAGIGPRAMIVGPANVGKSTLAMILANYAARVGRRPIYLDLDVGEGAAGMPGSLTALTVDRPLDIESRFARCKPLTLHYGKCKTIHFPKQKQNTHTQKNICWHFSNVLQNTDGRCSLAPVHTLPPCMLTCAPPFLMTFTTFF